MRSVAAPAPSGEGFERGHPRDQIREDDRRCSHRVPGGGRRCGRPRLLDGLDQPPRADVARPEARAIPLPAGIVLAIDPLRQTRHGTLGPRARRSAPAPRGADGRRESRHGCGRIRARRHAGLLRGWSDGDGVRRDVSGADDGADPLRDERVLETGRRLPVLCPHRRRARGLHRARGTDVGYAGVRGARAPGMGRALACRRRPHDRLARQLSPSCREPRSRNRTGADEPWDRRPPRTPGDPRPDTRPRPRR